MNAKSLISELARTFATEDEAAGDLWTWLPSHEYAVQLYGDHAHSRRPSLSELMRECSSVFAMLRNPTEDIILRTLEELRESFYELIWEEEQGEPPTTEQVRQILFRCLPV